MVLECLPSRGSFLSDQMSLRSKLGSLDSTSERRVQKLDEEIHELSDIEKLRLVDVILKDLDKPDPEMDRVWAVEARKRWAAYKAGKAHTVSHESVMSKHRL